MWDWTFGNGEAHAFVQNGNDMLLLLLLLNLQKYQATQPYQSIRGKDLSANMISIQLRNAYKTGEKTPTLV